MCIHIYIYIYIYIYIEASAFTPCTSLTFRSQGVGNFHPDDDQGNFHPDVTPMKATPVLVTFTPMKVNPVLVTFTPMKVTPVLVTFTPMMIITYATNIYTPPPINVCSVYLK